ncbi:MAG: nuclear transport factor 2 family protein [bacterium]
MTERDLKAVALAYLEAFDRRDLERCMEFFVSDAVIHFGPGVYAGRDAILEWHRDRFEADLRLTRLDRVVLEGDTVSANVNAVSDKIKLYGVDSVDAKVSLAFRGEKIREAYFSLLQGSTLESFLER